MSKASVFATVSLIQPSLIFMGMVGSMLFEQSPAMGSTLSGSSIAFKY
jgi:hypothetical protein